jgi:hypothetical protein
VSRVVPPATCAVQTARLYVLRARRLAAAGDREGARQARDLAQGWTALHAGLGGPRRAALKHLKHGPRQAEAAPIHAATTIGTDLPLHPPTGPRPR